MLVNVGSDASVAGGAVQGHLAVGGWLCYLGRCSRASAHSSPDTLVGTFFLSRLGQPEAIAGQLANLCLFGFSRSGNFVRHRQLEHRGLLALFQKGQKARSSHPGFKGVVMGAKDFFIDLTKDRSPVLDHAFTPGPRTQTLKIVCEGQFCAGQDTNSYA